MPDKKCTFCGGELTGKQRKYCSGECQSPYQPKCQGILCPIGKLGSCAICGDTTDSQYQISPGSTIGADGKWHGVWLCCGQHEEEWIKRHRYNSKVPFPYEKLADFGQFEFKKVMA